MRITGILLGAVIEDKLKVGTVWDQSAGYIVPRLELCIQLGAITTLMQELVINTLVVGRGEVGGDREHLQETQQGKDGFSMGKTAV